MQLEGTSRRLPIYLLLDVSGSMSGAPIEAVNNGLKDFEAALKSDPHAIESAYVSVITFESEAKQIIPLTEAARFRAPALDAGGGTALGRALNVLSQCLDSDVKPKSCDHPGDWKPLVFLMTDGDPTDDWRSSLTDFRNRTAQRPANLIPIGCGPNVKTSILRELSEQVLMMQDMSPEKIKALFQWISQSAKVASKSAGLQAAAGKTEGGADLPPPPPGIRIAL
jgi:uncharacterized protein YegL